MKRLLLDILTIVLLVSIISTVTDQVSTPTFDEQIANFEQQIENGVIYHPDKEVYLLQIEENYAGKLGNSLSSFVSKVINESVSIVKEIFMMF